MKKLLFRFALLIASMGGDGSNLISATQTFGKILTAIDCGPLEIAVWPLG
jgi:hypothetical protein